MTPVHSNIPTHQPHLHTTRQSDGFSETVSPIALRALLLLTEATTHTDPTLARIPDEDLLLLRVIFARLSGGELPSVA
jgi:hypothetical protein